MSEAVSEAPDDLKLFQGRRVLVTGDTGFKGSWLSLWLTDLGAEVIGYAKPADCENGVFRLAGLDRVYRHIDGDVLDLEHFTKVVRETRPEFVFHLAAQALVRASYADPPATFAVNMQGTVNVLEAIRLTDCVQTMLCITSDKCYRNKEWLWGYREHDELGGKDPYSASKAAAELAFRAYWDSFFEKRPGFGAATTRAGNVIGGGDRAVDRIVPDAIRSLEKKEPLILRSPAATRPWQHVLDPLHGYLQLAAHLSRSPKAFAGAWNFGPREDAIRTVGDLAQRVVKAWGGGEIIHRPDADAPPEARLLHLSSDLANRRLHWRPVFDFDQAAAETALWYRAVHEGASALEITRRQIAHFTESRLR